MLELSVLQPTTYLLFISFVKVSLLHDSLVGSQTRVCWCHVFFHLVKRAHKVCETIHCFTSWSVKRGGRGRKREEWGGVENEEERREVEEEERKKREEGRRRGREKREERKEVGERERNEGKEGKMNRCPTHFYVFY